MKLRFHKQEIFTYGQAVEAFGKQENITMIDATEGMFKNYGALLDKYYNNFKTRTIQKNHFFRVTNGDPSLNIQCSTHDGAEFMMQPMLKRGLALSDKRFEEIQKFVLQTLKPPGLRPIKQVELYKKSRTYVPRQYWDETFPKPSDEVLESVRKEKADKRKTKNNNDAGKTATKERKKTEAAEKKEKAAAERAKKKEDKQESTKKRKANADECKWYSALSV
jgi:hypothetical protein